MAEPEGYTAQAYEAPGLWPAAGLRAVPDRPLAITTQDVQFAADGVAASEGVIEGDGERLEFLGQEFRIAESIGIMPMLAFANASKRGVDSTDMAGLAAMYDLIRDVIWRKPLYDESGKRSLDDATGEPLFDESEWQRFERHATNEQATDEELMEFVGKVMGVLSARPRRRRAISSSGSPQTSEKSRASSSSPVTDPRAAGLVAVSDL